MKKRIDNILVVKVGTNTLTKKNDKGHESLDTESFRRIGEQIIGMKEAGYHVALVSSAAISAGVAVSGLKSRPDDMTALQRLASIGWRHVMNAWSDSLGGVAIGELLLTHHELGMPHERAEALRVAHSLLSNSDIAVINENDAISHKEIAFGDNDALAATLAAKMGRSELFGSDIKLVLLSDIDGVYRDMNDKASVISKIEDLSVYSHLALGSRSANGTGGMRTKFEAAEIVSREGIDMWIANGREDDVIRRALEGETGTHFSARISRESEALALSKLI